MEIISENYNRVKKSFECYAEKNNIDLEFPYYNSYVWIFENESADEILFSSGYKTKYQAIEFADKSHSEMLVGNAMENNIKWLGVFDASRIRIGSDR